MNAKDLSVERMKLVAHRLGRLVDDVVFLGGSITGLLVSDNAAPLARPTKDVDLILEVLSRKDYYELEKHLLQLGFVRPMEKNQPICRWTVNAVLVDIMPIDPRILGFSNRWYPMAFKNSVRCHLDDGIQVRIANGPSFLAMKLEAFLQRGKSDFLGSSDLEDFLYVVDGRAEIIDEILGGDEKIRVYLSAAVQSLLNEDRFRESLAGHLPPDPGSQARLPMLESRLQEIANMGS